MPFCCLRPHRLLRRDTDHAILFPGGPLLERHAVVRADELVTYMNLNYLVAASSAPSPGRRLPQLYKHFRTTRSHPFNHV